MKVIILSAGQGSRLMPLTEDKPKCAIQIGSRSVLEWQLNEISQCAVDEVVVVTGFAADRVDDIVARFRRPGLKVRCLFNPFFDRSDNLGTCWIARHEMNEPFVLLNGDTLFEAAVLQSLLACETDTPITLTIDRKDAYDDDDMKVVLTEDRLLRVGKKLGDEPVNGESIGMTRFTAAGAELFREELEHSMRRGEGLGRWYLSAIDTIAGRAPVGYCDIQGLGWCELDDRRDLEHARKVVPQWPTFPLQEVSEGG